MLTEMNRSSVTPNKLAAFGFAAFAAVLAPFVATLGAAQQGSMPPGIKVKGSACTCALDRGVDEDFLAYRMDSLTNLFFEAMGKPGVQVKANASGGKDIVFGDGA